MYKDDNALRENIRYLRGKEGEGGGRRGKEGEGR